MEELLEERSPCCGAFIDEGTCTHCGKLTADPDTYELDVQEDY
jgi:hypothetical protein